MAKESPSQRKTAGRVMHEYAHGELKSGKAGKGGKVKSRRQAIAIALHEAGASKYDSKAKNRQSMAKTKRKEATGKTDQQEAEGKNHVGALVQMTRKGPSLRSSAEVTPREMTILLD
jgi:hypothetical protein